MKKDENKFHSECIAHLLKLGASFERWHDIALVARYEGLEFTFFDSELEERTEVLAVWCRNHEGKKDNFLSMHSRRDALNEFKQHIAFLLPPKISFGFAGLDRDGVVLSGSYWSYVSAIGQMRMSKLKKKRLYCKIETDQIVYLS